MNWQNGSQNDRRQGTSEERLFRRTGPAREENVVIPMKKTWEFSFSSTIKF
jgi:hypothetical protein